MNVWTIYLSMMPVPFLIAWVLAILNFFPQNVNVLNYQDTFCSIITQTSNCFCRQSNLENIDDVPEEEPEVTAVERTSLSSSHSDWKNLGNFLRINLDNNQSTVIPLHNEMTILEVVENTCNKRQFDPAEYYLKLGTEDASGSTGKGTNWNWFWFLLWFLCKVISLLITYSQRRWSLLNSRVKLWVEPLCCVLGEEISLSQCPLPLL